MKSLIQDTVEHRLATVLHPQYNRLQCLPWMEQLRWDLGNDTLRKCKVVKAKTINFALSLLDLAIIYMIQADLVLYKQVVWQADNSHLLILIQVICMDKVYRVMRLKDFIKIWASTGIKTRQWNSNLVLLKLPMTGEFIIYLLFGKTQIKILHRLFQKPFTCAKKFNKRISKFS